MNFAEALANAGRSTLPKLRRFGASQLLDSCGQVVYNMTMIMVNIYEAKTKLSEYLEAAAKGERVVICKHNQPVAELRAVDPVRTAPRDLSPMYAGETFVTSKFFDPLPADEIAAWEGSGERGLKVADARGSYAARPARRARRKART
jgi:prevent-host-death family protein